MLCCDAISSASTCCGARASGPNAAGSARVDSRETISFETLLSYAALGLIVGFGYYMSIRLGAAGLPQGAPDWISKLLHGLRIGAAVMFFAWLASLGMAPILAAFAGFLAGRVIAFRSTGEDA